MNLVRRLRMRFRNRMNADEIRIELDRLLNLHADVLVVLRVIHDAMHQAVEAHDAALVSAIQANAAALRLLDRITTEGITSE